MPDQKYKSIDLIISDVEKRTIIINYIQSNFSGASINRFNEILNNGDDDNIQHAAYEALFNEAVVVSLTNIMNEMDSESFPPSTNELDQNNPTT